MRSNQRIESMFQSIAINESSGSADRHGPSRRPSAGQGRGADDDRQHSKVRAWKKRSAKDYCYSYTSLVGWDAIQQLFISAQLSDNAGIASQPTVYSLTVFYTIKAVAIGISDTLKMSFFMAYSFESLFMFVETASLGSFLAAARKLKKQQSTVSEAIANLEIDLGLTLFDRSTRGPTLTEQGKALLIHAQQVLDAGDRLSRSAHRLAAAWSRRSRWCCPIP